MLERTKRDDPCVAKGLASMATLGMMEPIVRISRQAGLAVG
jgi:hypothetical protein